MNIKVPGDGSMMESMDPDDEASGDETMTRKRSVTQREAGKGGVEPYHATEGASPPAFLQSGSAKHDLGSFDGGSLASATTPHGVPALGGLVADPAVANHSARGTQQQQQQQQQHPSTSGATKGGGNSLSTSSSTLNRKQLEEALLFQMELQKKLHDQLEVGLRWVCVIEQAESNLSREALSCQSFIV